MTDEFDTHSWEYQDSYSWSREYIVPGAPVCHICRVCRRPRSRRYHSEHPIPVDGVPPPPGICRRCRILPVDDTSSVGYPSNLRASHGIEPARRSLASDDESAKTFVVEESKDRELVQGGQAKRLRRHSVSYRYVEMAETPASPAAEEVEHGDSDTDGTDGSAVWIHPTRRGPTMSTDTWFKSRQSKSESVGAVPSKGGAASASGREEQATHTQNSTMTKNIDATIKEEIRQQLTREVQRIAREESIRYHEQSMKKHESPVSDERMRKIARDEVERYRQVERKMQAHGNVYAYGRLVPVNRSNDEGGRSSHVEQHKRSGAAASDAPARKGYRAAEVHKEVDSATIWHAGGRASSYSSSTSQALKLGASIIPLRTDASPVDGGKLKVSSMQQEPGRVSGSTPRGGSLGAPLLSNEMQIPQTSNTAQSQNRSWRTEAQIRVDPVDAESLLNEVQPSLHRHRDKASQAQRPLTPRSPEPPRRLQPPTPILDRTKPPDLPRGKRAELKPPVVDTIAMPRTPVSADFRNESPKTRPAVRLYYRHPEDSVPKSYRRPAERTMANDAATSPSLSRLSVDSQSGYGRISARRYSSDYHLESETYVYRRRPSPSEYMDELVSNTSRLKPRRSEGLSSRSASDVRSSRRDSIVDGARVADRSASFSPARQDTSDGSHVTSKTGDVRGKSSQTRSSPLIGVDQANHRGDAVPATQDAKLSRPKRGMLGPYAEDMRRRSESMKVHDGSMVSEDNRRTSHHDRRRRERR
jgi:hypothetical protein